jgi:hypothetical protein
LPSDRVGILSVNNNYVELDAESGPLKFHFGADNRLFWYSLPFSGDWDDNDQDTIGIFDLASQELRIAAQNDSDEYGGNVVHSIWITDAPPADAIQDKVTQFPSPHGWVHWGPPRPCLAWLPVIPALSCPILRSSIEPKYDAIGTMRSNSIFSNRLVMVVAT